MFYIPTSTALTLFELCDLFSDYISTQMAEDRDKATITLFPQLALEDISVFLC